MKDDPRLQPLLDELLDSHATPEEVCTAGTGRPSTFGRSLDFVSIRSIAST